MVTDIPVERTGRYLEVLPSSYSSAAPMPLVMDLHGYQEGLEIHRMMSNMTSTGEAHGFVVVIPEVTNTVPRWDASIGSPDTLFLAAVLDQVEANHCIDLNRVYVTGLSNGAFMTSVLACQLSDRVAAVAPVAGIRDPEGCAFQRPVPIITFHGTADTYVAYDGGLGSSVANLPTDDGGTIGTAVVANTGPTIEEIAAAWAGRNGCAASPPAVTAVAPDVDELAFDCPPATETELYRVNGGGHTWPGSAFSQQIESIVGYTTVSIDANELMWAFFQAHPLPA
jgi:polyhydroxybutyrate depolymerase